MNNRIFAQTLLSVVIILLSQMIYYGYSEYVQKHHIRPDTNIFYGSCILLLLGCVGLLGAMTRELNWLIISAIVLIYVTTAGMMFQDVTFLSGEKQYSYNIKIHHPDIWLLLNVIGWLLVGYAAPGPNSSDVSKMISTGVMMCVLFLQTYVIPKSRAKSIVDNPGYMGVVGLWIILAMQNADRTPSTSS